MTKLWFWFLNLVLTQTSHARVGRGAPSVMCPTHSLCPDKLFCLVLMTVINIFSNLFCWPVPLVLKIPVQRLCIVCLRTVILLRYKLGVVFFHSENSVILYSIVALTPCTCKLLLYSAAAATWLQWAQRAPGSGRHRCNAVTRLHRTFKMLLDFTRDRETPLHRHASYSSTDVHCNLQYVTLNVTFSTT